MDLYFAYLRFFLAFPLVILLIYLCFRYVIPRFAPALGMEERADNGKGGPNTDYAFVVRVGDEYCCRLLRQRCNLLNPEEATAINMRG